MTAKDPAKKLDGAILVAITACAASFVVTYNNTALIIALPVLKSEFDMSAVALQWVMNIYMLAAASFIVVMGRLSDIFGEMAMFVFGTAVFAATSFVLMFVDDTPMLLACRFMQGIGASSVFSNSAALINVTTPGPDRPFAIGIWAGVVIFGLGVGPLVGGFFTEVISWRLIFATDVVLLLIALFLAWRIKELGIVTPQPEKREPIDFVGASLIIITLATLVYALSNGHEAGWTSPVIVAMLATCIAAAVLFYVAEHRIKTPLVHFVLFENHSYVGATIAMFVVGFILIGSLFFINLFLQSPASLHMSGIEAGLAVLPMMIPMLLFSTLLPKRLERHHFRWAVSIGMLALAFGFWLMSFSTVETLYADIWWKFVILGCGLGLTYPLVPTVGLRDLADHHAGQGAGVINTCMYLGMILGVVVGGVVTAEVSHSFVAATVDSLGDVPHATVDLIRQLAHGSPTDVNQELARFSAADATRIRHTLAGLQDDTFDAVMTTMAVASLVGMAASVVLMRDQPKAVTPAH